MLFCTCARGLLQPEVWIAETLRLPHLFRDGGPIMASLLPMHDCIMASSLWTDRIQGLWRHSNVSMLVPASPDSIVASRIGDPHKIHRTEPY